MKYSKQPIKRIKHNKAQGSGHNRLFDPKRDQLRFIFVRSFIHRYIMSDDKDTKPNDEEVEEEEEEEEEEDLETLQAEIARMEAEAARITKETEAMEKKNDKSTEKDTAAAAGGEKPARDK